MFTHMKGVQMRKNKNYVLTVILDDELEKKKNFLIQKRGYNLSIVVRNYLAKLYETEYAQYEKSNTFQ